MATLISLSQAFANWKELSADIPRDDAPSLAESWNNYTDSLCKDGQLCALQYQYAPAYDDEMPDAGTRWDALAGDREFILEAMKVSVSAVFVPFSQSRNKSNKQPSLNWRVTLRKDDRDVIETDYMQGCGHCPAYKNNALKNSMGSAAHDKCVRQECETGRKVKSFVSLGIANAGAPIPPPSVSEVLSSLMLDASALDCRDFADWCGDFGYDADSIKARGMYDACLAIGLKLRAAFGEKALGDLRDLFADM